MHFTKQLSLLSLFALSVVAAPSKKIESFVADYEDLPGNVAGSPNVFGPPTPYLDLDYSGVVVASNSPLAVDAVLTTSGKNYLATNPGQNPDIKVHSNISCCNFNSLLIGTFLSAANGDAAPAVDSTVRFTGITTDGKTIIQDYNYRSGVTNLNGVALQNAFEKPVALKNFNKITELTITVVKSAGIVALTGIDFDRLAYTCFAK
ncbi:hypothetical protein LTS18_004722 [Coniosporium uncinatum]|uniref:Uncharacterized protein n=1 Tax=Coniosporium uncinatum TaxID=93489 RepID=A0ACC3DXS6_9PEZI|nr:hypothetical protein LTS18_004722 [Coniosporium uncinatum]